MRPRPTPITATCATPCSVCAPPTTSACAIGPTSISTPPHRRETRGIGGLFADRLGADAADRAEVESWFPLIQQIAGVFFPAWAEIAVANRARPYGAAELAWQRLRRGRYAEFNLAIDRGTRFGLETGGRTESILMSLPPLAAWEYDVRPVAGSAEAITQEWLRKGVEWADMR